MVDVSIIIPAYNVSKYIEKCLNSLINQTLKNVEIIVINDGSTDNTLDIIKSFKDERIKIIDLKVNKGIGNARNLGIKKAKGKYIGFVDSDDYVDKKMFETMYNKAIKEDLDLVICDFYKVIENTKEKIKIDIPNFENTNIYKNPKLLLDIELCPWNKLYKSKLIKNTTFPTSLKYEDVPFVFKALKNAKNIGKVNKYFNYYIVHDKSETTKMDEKVYDIFKILDLVNDYNNNEYKSEIEYLNIRALLRYTLQQRNQINKEIKYKFVDDAFKYLNKKYPNWKQNKYLNQRPFLKKIIETNKFLTKIYIKIT